MRQQQNVISPEVLLLFDDSGSMTRQDPYTGDPEARAALQALTGKPPETLSRTDIALAVRDEVEQLVTDRGYIPRTFRFSEDLEPLASGSSLDGKGSATAIGDAIRAALAGHRGRYVSDVVIVSDVWIGQDVEMRIGQA